MLYGLIYAVHCAANTRIVPVLAHAEAAKAGASPARIAAVPDPFLLGGPVFYSMILVGDQAGEQATYVFIPTSRGRMVILFEDLKKMDFVSEYVPLEPGQQLMTAQGDFASVEDVARKIVKDQPHLSDAMFVTDSDPLVTQLIAFLREGGRPPS